MPVVYVSGPHGSGKSTLIQKLTALNLGILKNTFEIDFMKDFPSMPTMSIFEKCLLRLYHRFYTAKYAESICDQLPDDNKVMLIDRSLYDSLAYINTENELGELSAKEYQTLISISRNAISMINPRTIILNPDVDIVLSRLERRRQMGIRKERDLLCAREDTYTYVNCVHNALEQLQNNGNILYIKDNSDREIEKIIKWLGL